MFVPSLLVSILALDWFQPLFCYNHPWYFSGQISAKSRYRVKCLASTLTSARTLGPPMAINTDFPGLQKVHNDPDIYIIENFLDEASCTDMIELAKVKKLERSPVAYAGWTTDVKELLALAAKGPVSWLAIFSAWIQTKDDNTASIFDFIKHTLLNYPIFYLIAAGGISTFIKSRTDGLQAMRTSTSTTLDRMDNLTSGAAKFVITAAKLFESNKQIDSRRIQREASFFEAPTIIRYESGQVLKPHFDANRDAETEDATRGGQTLATLIVYLNNVETGGRTRFGKLLAPTSSGSGSSNAITTAATITENEGDPYLSIAPKQGDALLFFPADRDGRFDERTEHEGCPAVDEKWIARIWRHRERVSPPYGLTNAELAKLADLPPIL